jgi:hypothetical protein
MAPGPLSHSGASAPATTARPALYVVLWCSIFLIIRKSMRNVSPRAPISQRARSDWRTFLKGGGIIAPPHVPPDGGRRPGVRQGGDVKIVLRRVYLTAGQYLTLPLQRSLRRGVVRLWQCPHLCFESKQRANRCRNPCILPTVAVLTFPITAAVAELIAVTSLRTSTRLGARSRYKVGISLNFALMVYDLRQEAGFALDSLCFALLLFRP